MQKKNEENLLEITKKEQYETIEDLIKKGGANNVYYTLLFLSSVVISAGLLLGNAPVVIGGMLVTPLLTPLLVISLGLSVGDLKTLKTSGILVLKSFGIIFAVGFVLAIFFDKPSQDAFIFDDSLRTGLLYFIVAFISGVAATFAWVRKEVSEILPGIAVAVSLVPPLCLLGIYLSDFDLGLLRGILFVFVFNILGILLGSMIVFSLLKFYKTSKKIEEKIDSNS